MQNLEPNWQLFGEMNIFNEDFGSLIPSLSLTLTCREAGIATIQNSCILSVRALPEADTINTIFCFDSKMFLEISI
jgi:hypothetical protein